MPARSDHFDGQRFFNPTGPALQPFTAVPRMLLTRRVGWPRYVPDVPRQPPARDTARPVVTFIGHATFLIQTEAGNILTDPIYSTHAGPWNLFGPRRVRPPAIAFDALPPISIVLLSHNHYDHCDLRTLRMLARRFDPLVVTPLGNGRFARAAGIRRVEELDWWQRAVIGCADHVDASASLFGPGTARSKSRPVGRIHRHCRHARIYFAGDTAYAPFFHDIRQRLGPIDLALLPIGAYEPRWFMKSVHMNPAEAVQAHLDLRREREHRDALRHIPNDNGRHR